MLHGRRGGVRIDADIGILNDNVRNVTQRRIQTFDLISQPVDLQCLVFRLTAAILELLSTRSQLHFVVRHHMPMCGKYLQIAQQCLQPMVTLQ